MTTVESEDRTEAITDPELTALAVAVAVKEFAKTIRESSDKMRETLKTFHQTGVIDEISDAIRAAALATRDTAREIEEISKEIKDRGVIMDTKNALKDVAIAVQETEKTLKESFTKRGEPSTESGRRS